MCKINRLKAYRLEPIGAEANRSWTCKIAHVSGSFVGYCCLFWPDKAIQYGSASCLLHWSTELCCSVEFRVHNDLFLRIIIFAVFYFFLFVSFFPPVDLRCIDTSTCTWDCTRSRILQHYLSLSLGTFGTSREFCFVTFQKKTTKSENKDVTRLTWASQKVN